MPTSKTKKHDELRGKIAQAREQEREIAQAPGRLRAEYEVLAEQLMEHDLPIDGTPPSGGEARKLWDQRVAVKARLDGPWDARFQKARSETAKREAELAEFVGANLGDLVAEVKPDAERVRETVIEKAADLDAAIADWHGVESRVASLLGPVPGLSGADIPRLPLDPLRQELRRLEAEKIPVPLPRVFDGTGEGDEAAEQHARSVEGAVTSDA